MTKRDPFGVRLQEYERNVTNLAPITGDDAGSEVMRMGMKSLKEFQYTPKYENTPEGLQRFSEKAMSYFEYINRINVDAESTKKLLPDVEGLAVWLGISRKTLLMYERERGGKWSEYIGLLKTLITSVKKQRTYNFQVPPVFMMFDLKNNSNYVDKYEVEASTDGAPKAEMTPEEVQRKMLEDMPIDSTFTEVDDD